MEIVSSLYLCDEYDPTYKRKDWAGLNKEYCTIPDDTDCFVLKTNNNPHGVDYIEDDNKKIIAVCYWKVKYRTTQSVVRKK